LTSLSYRTRYRSAIPDASLANVIASGARQSTIGRIKIASSLRSSQ
jgi:hypothetical protein